MGLAFRLPQLQQDVSILEKEDDGDLYGAVSLQVIENELSEIKLLVDKLNSITQHHLQLTNDTTEQVGSL